MLDNTLSITWNTVPITLTRVKEQSYSSEYRGEDGDEKFILTVQHTEEGANGGESHSVKLTVKHFDVNGVYLRTSSAWTVLKTFDGSQVTSDVTEAHSALASVVDAAFITRIANMES